MKNYDVLWIYISLKLYILKCYSLNFKLRKSDFKILLIRPESPFNLIIIYLKHKMTNYSTIFPTITASNCSAGTNCAIGASCTATSQCSTGGCCGY